MFKIVKGKIIHVKISWSTSTTLFRGPSTSFQSGGHLIFLQREIAFLLHHDSGEQSGGFGSFLNIKLTFNFVSAVSILQTSLPTNIAIFFVVMLLLLFFFCSILFLTFLLFSLLSCFVQLRRTSLRCTAFSAVCLILIQVGICKN